jgi:DNA-binding MarR family transcriptional regulator
MKSNLAKDNPYMRMIVNILKTGNIIDHKVSEVLKEFDITHIQFNILRILEADYTRKLSVGEIATGLLFPTSDVTRLLDRLTKRGLIQRTRCETNRRKVEISITHQGLQIIALSLPKIGKKLDNFYENRLTEEERDYLDILLKRLRN